MQLAVGMGTTNMTINRELAEDCGLDEHEILEIESLHEALDALISKWIREPYSEDRAEDIHSLEYRLQQLWGFLQIVDTTHGRSL